MTACFARSLPKVLVLGGLAALLFSGCRLTYLLHAGAGQLRLLRESVPLDQALQAGALTPERQERVLLVARVKAFGEDRLGLKKTRNYETLYLKSPLNPVYVVAAAPKDRLELVDWWFPLVGRVPYLGYFDPEEAAGKRDELAAEGLDVTVGEAGAYSTLGWFRDPITLNLIEGPVLDLVETILHEMTHTTLYVKGQGPFNEGLANLVGKEGARLFLEETYGPLHPLALEAGRCIADERLFSSFLDALLEELETLYASPLSGVEKRAQREEVFAASRERFARLRDVLLTDRFAAFGRPEMNNAYLLTMALYHRHYLLFEAFLRQNGGDIEKTLSICRRWAGVEGPMLDKVAAAAAPGEVRAP